MVTCACGGPETQLLRSQALTPRPPWGGRLAASSQPAAGSMGTLVLLPFLTGYLQMFWTKSYPVNFPLEA